jgi:hypothetical protein
VDGGRLIFPVDPAGGDSTAILKLGTAGTAGLRVYSGTVTLGDGTAYVTANVTQGNITFFGGTLEMHVHSDGTVIDDNDLLEAPNDSLSLNPDTGDAAALSVELVGAQPLGGGADILSASANNLFGDFASWIAIGNWPFGASSHNNNGTNYRVSC